MAASCGQEKIRWVTTIILSSSLQYHEISTTLQNQQHRVRYSDSVEDGSIIFSLSGVAFLLADAQDLLFANSKVIFERIKKFMTIHRSGFLLLSAALHGQKEWEMMFRVQQSLQTWVCANKEYHHHVSPLRIFTAAAGISVLFVGMKHWSFNCHKTMKTRHLVLNYGSSYRVLLTEETKCDYIVPSSFLGSNLRIVPVHNTAEAIKLMLTIAKTSSKPYLDNIRYRMLMAKAQIIEQSPVWKMLHHIQLH